ncbi:myb/SANT-like DNA-binding domain-containing protein 3 [Acyrthosiphon pisum]|uniref:Regulatory protein zeste n=1 Tax=Acyrthosiphon pisum TaxID=7029 RepID=A0A8R1WYH4_ACYPI|nr:myb/SANT-like DNA-binding domain-containing protein 3 [Acyrthosiphon pisum]|eukprot:XP_008179541.1 PREDICTED: myb/SANT-like DNA-binding domain-containing protein 3 [Acyrthosiphon pisum]
MGKGLAYSASEKSLIIELIQLNKVVENKKTDAFSIHDKNKAWESITKTFNASGDHPKRTVSQVKKCWHNIKTKRKSEITSHKQAVLRTGGGPAVEKLVENPLIDEFANIACEIPGAIDSDTIASHNITCVTTSDGYLEFNIQPSDDNLSDSNINDTDANFTNAVPTEATSRIERVEIQKINDEEIHNLLKEELLLKIENERELLKRRKIETEVASNDLIFRKEKHLTEMELLKRTINE